MACKIGLKQVLLISVYVIVFENALHMSGDSLTIED